MVSNTLVMVGGVKTYPVAGFVEARGQRAITLALAGSTPAFFKAIALLATMRFADVRGHHEWIAAVDQSLELDHATLSQNRMALFHLSGGTVVSDDHQYRFQSIVDPKTGRVLCEIEHEVRSLFHPMYERALVNRNADQSIFSYSKGRDAFPG